ncbi:unnamed protein product [Prorocentrum cordatum]|uniref:MORN repeat-containing protein n=1 Tax=Prorocentrum cordatum TaxID=2364126 RepID=A0ABN9TQL1_9DINO|nr:unnamed protein product [Polarella glacialis]
MPQETHPPGERPASASRVAASAPRPRWPVSATGARQPASATSLGSPPRRPASGADLLAGGPPRGGAQPAAGSGPPRQRPLSAARLCGSATLAPRAHRVATGETSDESSFTQPAVATAAVQRRSATLAPIAHRVATGETSDEPSFMQPAVATAASALRRVRPVSASRSKSFGLLPGLGASGVSLPPAAAPQRPHDSSKEAPAACALAPAAAPPPLSSPDEAPLPRAEVPAQILPESPAGGQATPRWGSETPLQPQTSYEPSFMQPAVATAASALRRVRPVSASRSKSFGLLPGLGASGVSLPPAAAPQRPHDSSKEAPAACALAPAAAPPPLSSPDEAPLPRAEVPAQILPESPAGGQATPRWGSETPLQPQAAPPSACHDVTTQQAAVSEADDVSPGGEGCGGPGGHRRLLSNSSATEVPEDDDWSPRELDTSVSLSCSDGFGGRSGELLDAAAPCNGARGAACREQGGARSPRSGARCPTASDVITASARHHSGGSGASRDSVAVRGGASANPPRESHAGGQATPRWGGEAPLQLQAALPSAGLGAEADEASPQVEAPLPREEAPAQSLPESPAGGQATPRWGSETPLQPQAALPSACHDVTAQQAAVSEADTVSPSGEGCGGPRGRSAPLSESSLIGAPEGDDWSLQQLDTSASARSSRCSSPRGGSGRGLPELSAPSRVDDSWMREVSQRLAQGTACTKVGRNGKPYLRKFRIDSKTSELELLGGWMVHFAVPLDDIVDVFQGLSSKELVVFRKNHRKASTDDELAKFAMVLKTSSRTISLIFCSEEERNTVGVFLAVHLQSRKRGATCAPVTADPGPPAPTGAPEGRNAKVAYPDSSVYEGQYRNRLRHGQGVLTLADGKSYACQWSEGKPHGTGEERWPDKTFFSGCFLDGLRHGEGTMSYPDGSSYVGEFARGQFNGQGVFKRADGSCYRGGFSDGLIHGEGYMEFSSGAWKRYAGQWKDGLYHGAGTLTDCQGDTISGQFVAGQLPHQAL